MSAYSIVERGKQNDTSYRIYYKDSDGVPISPFHDIPLYADKEKEIFNMIVEIPRWSNKKMEIATQEPLNPIRQDIKNNKLRFINNIFPVHGSMFNYGALPQTWENPNHIEKSIGSDTFFATKGDNDPIDVVEIGSRVRTTGDVIQVKLLGGLLVIDNGETDWKLIMIDVNDSDAELLNDIDDIKKLRPGLIEAVGHWYEVYKTPDGNPPNKIAYDGKAKKRDFVLDIISLTHKHWNELINGVNNKSVLDLRNATISSSAHKVSDTECFLNAAPDAVAGDELTDEQLAQIDKWYYV